MLSALSLAVSREGDNPVVCQKDLLKGANLQLRGRLKMKVRIKARHCNVVLVIMPTYVNFLGFPSQSNSQRWIRQDYFA